MNKRDAATVALLVTASSNALGAGPMQGEGIPDEDEMRINEAAREWGWSVLRRHGLSRPFATAEDAYVHVDRLRAHKRAGA